MKKPTLRQNGIVMTTISVKHHLSLSDLTICCIKYLNVEINTSDIEDLNEALLCFTKKGFEEHLRYELEDQGYYATVEPHYTYDEEIETKVEKFLQEKYPGWK